jgi:hypothetical protein
MVASNFRTFDSTGWTRQLVPAPRRRESSAIDFPRLIRSLERIDAHDYQTWIKVGLALKNESPDLMGVWEWWSRTSNKAEGVNFASQWESLDPDGRVTLGSILHWGREPEDAPAYETLNLNDLLEGDYRVTFLIDGYLVKGQMMLCVGPQKSLKTTLLLYMALCLATGSPFLGQPVTQSKVLMLSGESGLATLQETARRQLPTLGKCDPHYFQISTTLPKLNQPLGELEALMVKLGTEVLILDPAYLCLDGSDAGNMFAMGQQLKNLADLCVKLGVTPIIAHHTTKSASRDNEPLDLADMAWSGFGEFARQWLLLSRRESFAEGTGQHKLFVKAGSSAWGGSLTHVDVSEGHFPNRVWEIEHRSASHVAAVQEDADFQSCCEKAFALLEKPLTKTKLREKLKISRRFDPFFTKAIQVGAIVQVGSRGCYPLYGRKVANEP